MAFTADRGVATPYPFQGIDLTIFPKGEIGTKPICLSFDRIDDLLPNSRDGGNLGDSRILECRARTWDACWQNAISSEIYDRAQAACGLTSFPGRTPQGSFKIHVFDRFVAYSEPSPPGPFRLAADNMTPDLVDLLLDVVEPGDQVFRIAAFYHRPPSSHILLDTHARLTAWLKWLAADQNWRPFAPLRSLPPWAP